MSASAVYVLDLKGKVLICRNYRGDVDMSEVEHFMPILMEKEEEGMLSPILAHGGVRFMWIKHNNLYLVATSKKNACVSLVFSFLYKVVQVFSEYFKELEEESIRDNFVIIYELLDELMDFGYPQTTDSKILQEYITQEGHKLETGAPRPPATVTNAVSWRSEGIKYRKNEVFLDVIESVNLLVGVHLSVRLCIFESVLFSMMATDTSRMVQPAKPWGPGVPLQSRSAPVGRQLVLVSPTSTERQHACHHVVAPCSLPTKPGHRTALPHSLFSVLCMVRFLFLLFYILFTYLRGRVTESGRDRERERGLPSAGSLPRWPQRPELCESEARNQELLPGLPCRCRGPRTWAVFYCFPRPQQRAGQEVEQPGLEPAPIWDAGSAPGGFARSA
uniref:Adaptor related protein complex 1 subunit mu 1 n=1 Tax=Oryctolagus cuniculus TaxID=9986 RepID=G1TZV3_RABIT